MVVAAGDRSQPYADRALEELCQAYWYPLYAFARRHQPSREDAEDLTQAFFASILSRNSFAGLEKERGRFRAFLLASLKNFMANAWDKSQAIKRGGSIIHLSLDYQNADSQFQIAACAGTSPDRAFDREWAVTLLGTVIERLRTECESSGRREQFAELKLCLTAGKGAVDDAGVAQRLDLNEGAVRVAAHRLRKRYRELLRDEIAQTLADPSHVDEELQVLFGAFER